MKKLFLILLSAFAFAACDKDNAEGPSTITVTNPSELNQTVFADNTQGQGGVKFTTAGAWSSTIVSKTRADVSTWVSIDPASGDKAGEYTVNIKLDPNYTGETRKAEIKISCSGYAIDINIEQKGTTQSGEIPEPRPEPSGSGVLTNESTQKSFKLTGVSHEISNYNVVRIVFEGEDEVDGKVERASFMADFRNPLQRGQLQAGEYRVEDYTPREDGVCCWMKSSLGGYGEAGTIRVELEGNVYTFTMNIQLETGTTEQYATLNGSFAGVPRYLNEEVKVGSITLNETQKRLELGGEVALVATVLPENATNKNFTWSSSNTAVATVSEEGLVRGVAAGVATITATTMDGNNMATCAVTVNAAVAVQSIKVSPTTLSMLEGETHDGPINVTVAPENATNKNYTWASSKPEVAEYDGKAVRAKTAGETTITFTTEEGAKTATLTITVSARQSSGSGSLTVVDKAGKYDDQLYSLIEVTHTILSKTKVELSFKDSNGNGVVNLRLNNPLSN